MPAILIRHARRGTLALAGASAVLLSLGCATPVDASPLVRPYAADDTHCHAPTPTQLAWLDGAAWSRFASAVRVCEVGQGSGPAALLVTSVWEQHYYADKPDGTVQVDMPRPLLLAADGRKLGELPQNFPTDAPDVLQLRFAGWKGGLPTEIRLCVISPTPGGNFALAPLRLGPSGHYESTGRKPVPSLKDECHGQ
jgi:hypothetical protein